MKRRHLVVLISAITLLTILFVAAVTIGVGVGTDAGRDQIRSLVEREVASRVNGKVHIGRVIDGGLGGITLDSFAIRDRNDSLLVSMGRVSVEYDVRDLLDRRILLRNVELEHPVIRLQQFEKGDWNFQRILKKDGPSAPNVPGRSFGDYVVLDSVHVSDGEFIMTRPWTPDDSLRGAKRDSAIRVNIANPNREIRRSAEGFTHTYRWSHMTGFLPRVRLADPDSNRFGQLVVFDSTRVDELEPPFKIRNARGVVRRLGDSMFVEMPHFDLPASTGSAQGKIWWGSGLPVRMDIRIKGDSVSLNDVAFVYETLPRVGGGRTNIRITRSQDLRRYQFALSEMDVRSTRSRLTGAMTFETGGPVLAVKDVDLRGAPINFDLVRTLAGGPLSVDWQGDLYGIVRGPGGPLTNFVVDTSFVTFRDAHVIGAISQGSGRGELDILDPELTEFHGFDVNAVSLDLRSIQYLFPEFPRIGGTVSGVARLDSSWLDVRFSNADVTHRNGPGDPTRVTGSGRVTIGETFLSYDVAVNAQPLSLTMMSRAYPLGLKGLMSGPITAKGTTDDLQLTMQLEGPAGRFSYSGKVDAYPLSVAARGAGRVDALDLAQILEHPKTPAGFVTGSYQLDVRGDTNDLGTLQGSAIAQLERSELDGIRVFPSRVRARFADGRMYVDTLRIESVAATVTADGAIGLTRRTPDSLSYQVVVDSLGGLRRYVERLTSAWRTASTAATDSIAGRVEFRGTARGSLAAVDLSGSVVGSNVFLRREAGRRVTGTFSLANALTEPSGTINLGFNALNVGGIAIDTLGVDVRLTGPRRATFTLGALARNRVRLVTNGEVAIGDSTTNILLRAVELATDSGSWSLRGPANVALEKNDGITIDSVILTNRNGGRVAVSGFVPDTGRARMFFRADSIPLRDVGQIAQFRNTLSGMGHLSATGTGTAGAPMMSMDARLSDVRYGGIRLERVTANGQYAGGRAQVGLNLTSGGRTALVANGSLPVQLSYFGAELLEDSLRATVRTDSASLSLIEALVPSLDSATGRLVANLDIGGTWKHLDVSGPLRVEGGEVSVDSLGIRIRGVNVDLAFFGHRDSLVVRRMVGWSGESAADSVSLRGYIAYRDVDNPYLDLRLNARSFYAFDKRSRARLYVSTEGGSGLRLRGQLRGASLTGGLVVDRGVIFLPDPELARKRFVDFSSVLRDTAATVGAAPSPAERLFESVLFDGVRITLGEEVWLRSPEANIKLGGTLNVQRRPRRTSTVALGGEIDPTLVPVLDGQLRAERGTYTLDLGRVVQREFQVEGGTITYFETAGLTAVLNITAIHTVRAATGADVRIRVRLTGPIDNPILTLESAESYAMSQSDMVSYLLFGYQNFELGTEGKGLVQVAAQTLFPSATTFGAGQLRDVLGPFTDFLQLRPGTADWSGVGTKGTRAMDSFEDAFWSSRVGGEKQITENVFVSVSSGLCPIQQGRQGQTQNGSEMFFEGLSGRFEYRFSRDASVKLGKEPSASTCSRASVNRVVAAPSQWGLSFFKTWRF